MRPPLPVPLTAAAGISRSANILRAAGLGACAAYEGAAGVEAVGAGAGAVFETSCLGFSTLTSDV